MHSNIGQSDAVLECTNTSSQKKIKEEINQSLIDSCSSDKIISNLPEEESANELGMSVNIATKLNQLSLRSSNDLTEIYHESSVRITTSNIPRKTSGMKATPKQVFPNIPCLPLDNNIIFCYVLSVWDNIVGPQTVYVWKRKSKLKSYILGNEKPCKKGNEKNIILETDVNDDNKKNKDTLKRTNSIPSRNICKKDNNSVRYKKSLLRSHSVEGNKDLTNKIDADGSDTRRRLCLSTVVKYVTEHTVGVGEGGRWNASKMVSFLLHVPHQDIIILSVRFHVIEDGVGVPYCLSAVISSRDESLLIPVLNLTTETMSRIAAKVRLLISKEGLVGGEGIKENLQELCSTLSSLNKACLSHYPLASLTRCPDDRRMAEKMLTSHLQTMGTTLVIANSPSEANRVVMWLGQFLTEENLSTSRIALSDCMWPYQPGLSVQAVIRDASGSIDLSSSKLLTSKRPLTLIDLGSSSVRQMAPLNIHSKNSSATFRMELLALWHDLDHMPAPSQSLFESVEVAAPIVRRFLHEWDRLASCEAEVRKVFLGTFLRSIRYMALALIVWTRHEWSNEKRRKDTKSLVQALCSTFVLEEADLKIILAEAEIIEPGFIALLFGKLGKD